MDFHDAITIVEEIVLKTKKSLSLKDGNCERKCLEWFQKVEYGTQTQLEVLSKIEDPYYLPTLRNEGIKKFEQWLNQTSEMPSPNVYLARAYIHVKCAQFLLLFQSPQYLLDISNLFKDAYWNLAESIEGEYISQSLKNALILTAICSLKLRKVNLAHLIEEHITPFYELLEQYEIPLFEADYSQALVLSGNYKKASEIYSRNLNKIRNNLLSQWNRQVGYILTYTVSLHQTNRSEQALKFLNQWLHCDLFRKVSTINQIKLFGLLNFWRIYLGSSKYPEMWIGILNYQIEHTVEKESEEVNRYELALAICNFQSGNFIQAEQILSTFTPEKVTSELSAPYQFLMAWMYIQKAMDFEDVNHEMGKDENEKDFVSRELNIIQVNYLVKSRDILANQINILEDKMNNQEYLCENDKIRHEILNNKIKLLEITLSNNDQKNLIIDPFPDILSYNEDHSTNYYFYFH